MQTLKLPKAELHNHLEGSIFPDKAKELAARNGMKLPDEIFTPGGTYAYTDFLDFLKKYDIVSSVIKTPEDFHDVAYHYLEHLAKANTIYAEMIISPDHGKMNGLSYKEVLNSVVKAIDKAHADFGIVARIVMTGVRHLGVPAVEQVANAMVKNPHPYVVGFHLSGDEFNYPPAQFRKAYDIVYEAGIRCACHAGEAAGAWSVREAIESLPMILRIGHGVRAIEDMDLVKEVIDRGITFEVCPTSNIKTGVFPDYKSHPLLTLMDMGAKVTLNSDDPCFFDSSLAHEYEIGKTTFGLSDDDLINITKTAIENSFADEKTKFSLLTKLNTF